MKFFLVAITLISFGVSANECVELNKCVEYISKLTAKKYIYDGKEVKGGLQATSNLQITNENADTLFTYILDLNGYARVPTAEKDTYVIVSARDIRYQPVPVINVDAHNPPKLTPNYDYYMMSFKFKHFAHGQMREAANSLRPFMSRYARVIELKVPGTITIQENAAKLLKAYELIKFFDRELTKEEIMKEKEREAEWKEERKAERKERRIHKEEPKEEKK